MHPTSPIGVPTRTLTYALQPWYVINPTCVVVDHAHSLSYDVIVLGRCCGWAHHAWIVWLRAGACESVCVHELLGGVC